MGGSSSKNEFSDNEGGEISNSSGFHVFEIHLPTAGKGLVVLIIISICAYLLYKWRKRCTRGSQTALPNQHSFAMSQLAPYLMLQPFQPFPAFQPVSLNPLAFAQQQQQQQQQRFQPGVIEEVVEEGGKASSQDSKPETKRPAFRFQNQDP